MYKYVGANKKFKLTNENYYTQEANEHYVSIHTFTNFFGTPYKDGCQARTLYELENPIEQNDAMLIGSYIDAYYDNTLEEFKANTPQLFKKDGSLLAKYEICDLMIKRANEDKLFSKYMTGKKQQIFTGSFAGLDWKIKTDNLPTDKNGEIIALVDTKTTRDIHTRINGYTFIEAFGYDFQLALYQEILRQNINKRVPTYICAISKEEVPETAVIYIDNDTLNQKLEIIKNNADTFKDLLERKIEPTKCNQCDYCKSIRVNDKVINYQDL